jgi:hypothetical protein
MQDALDKFSREAEQIIASFRKNLESQKPPPIIYHYTDAGGLRGILETGQLWLTDIFNLNDPSELSHGFSHGVKVLDSMVANGPPEGKVFAERLAGFAHQRGIQESAHFFVCSFTSWGDDLGQWRAYADNGRGYALGFDANALEKTFAGIGFTKDGIPNTFSFPITYKDAELAKIHRQIIESMLGLISLPRGRNLQGAAINSYMTELSVWLMVHMLHAAVFFKHEGYYNEKEYRFLQMYMAGELPEMKRRARRCSLINYKEFDWKSGATGALKQIVVGPAADREKARHFAEDCLRLFYTGTATITHSDIPYRAA